MRNLPYHLLALFVVICWGLAFVSTKVLYAYGMGPWAVVALRAVLAYGLLIFIAPKNLYAGSFRNEVTVALLGFASVPLSYGLQNQALVTGQASTVAVLVAMGPVLTGLLAMAALRTWKMHWMTMLGLVASVTGALLLYFDAVVMQELSQRGFILGIAAAAAYALYALLLRALGDLPPLFVLRKATGYGVIGAIPFFLKGPRKSSFSRILWSSQTSSSSRSLFQRSAGCSGRPLSVASARRRPASTPSSGRSRLSSAASSSWMKPGATSASWGPG